mgnify:CR=1 FL=1
MSGTASDLHLGREADQHLLSLRRRATELEKLQAVSDTLARVVSPDQTLRLIVENLVSLGYSFAAFLALDNEKGVLSDYVISTGNSPLIKEAQNIIPHAAKLPLSLETHPAVRCIRTLEVQTTQDLAAITTPVIGARTARTVQQAAGLKSIAVVPVLVGGKPFGVWIAGSNEKEALDAADIRTLMTFANHAGLTIERAQLYDRLLQRTVAQDQALHELREAQDHLVRSERLSSMGRLAASIAHEVNNPLQAVRTCLELSLEEMELNQPVDRENLEMACREIGRVTRLIHRLNNLQRPAGREKRPVEINVTLQEVLSLMEKQFALAEVAVRTNLGSNLPLVLGHSDQLAQVFLNLSLNALEAMPHGGTLRVATSSACNEWVMVTFADNGVGISAEALSHVFEPFFTTKTDGLGLGLTVCLTIVEAHGGRLELHSGPNEGTLCEINLPTCQVTDDRQTRSYSHS